MSHYLLAAMRKHDAEGFAEYQAGSRRTLGAYRMRPEAITEEVVTVLGELEANVLVLIRFEDEAEFHAWWDSEEYAQVKPLREKSAETLFAVTFPGVD
jgi:uncharacterized protein (DUF1330 family)